MKGHKISVKISLNLRVPTSVLSVTVRLNFEVLTAETPSVLRASPFVKLSTNRCYDWSSEIGQ